MSDSGKPSGKRGGPLPLSEDDMATAFGGARPVDEQEHFAPVFAISYIKMFFTIILAAPFAALLVVIVLEGYDTVATVTGLRQAPVIEEPEETADKSQMKNFEENERFAKLVKAFERNNNKIVRAINKQTAATLKLANKKPDTIKVMPQKIVVVKVPTSEQFNLAYEKGKVLELAGIDLDDPVSGPAQFANVRSKAALREVIRSLDAIIKASKYDKKISSFLKGNALKAKKYAKQRLSKNG